MTQKFGIILKFGRIIKQSVVNHKNHLISENMLVQLLDARFSLRSIYYKKAASSNVAFCLPVRCTTPKC